MFSFKAKNLNFSYTNSKILENINFDIKSGEAIGIIGPNGGGKSTLLKILSNQLKIKTTDNIELYFNNLKVKQLNPKKDFSYLPQEKNFKFYFPISVLEFLNFALLNLKTSPLNFDYIVDIFQLQNILDKHFSTLSGGQKQKVMLARVFMRNTPLVFLDEPMLGLDSKSADQLNKIIKKLKQENNFALIMIDHNLDCVMQTSQKILCLNKSGHWHGLKNDITEDTLKFYHCEYEHQQIHNQTVKNIKNDTNIDHRECLNHKIKNGNI